MKVGGVSTEIKDYGPIVFNRGEELMAFFARPVMTYEPFTKAFPEPVPPENRFNATGSKVANPEDKQYLLDKAAWWDLRHDFYVLTSLQPSRIEWDGIVTVAEDEEGNSVESKSGRSLDQPETWAGTEAELKEKLSDVEFQRISNLIDVANALDERKLAANAATFFLQQEAMAKGKTSQTSEQDTTPSGEPA